MNPVAPPAPERLLWQPVLAVDALGAAPVAVRVFDTELVLWRDPAGAVAAFDDRCPHRGTRLSLGQVRDGRLECPYHGWRFDLQGRCVHVPADPAFKPPASHAACRHALQAAHGLWWLRLEDGPAAEPSPPGLPGLPPRQLVCGPYDVRVSAPRVVENFLDTAHFAFVHPDGLGDRAHARVPPYDVQLDAAGRPGVMNYRAWQPRSSALAQGGDWIDYRYQVLGPYCAVLEKKPGAPSPQSLHEAYALWVCPETPVTSRVWFTLWTNDTGLSDDALRGFQDAVFLQDRPILESQRPPQLPLEDGEVHGPADRLASAYRRFLRTQGIRFGAITP